MHIIAVGLNHKVAPVAIRERLALSDTSLSRALSMFKAENHAEWSILSTCNRLEVYNVAPDVQQGRERICSFLSAFHGISRQLLAEYLYTYVDESAVSHLFAVASGLDSMILGEPQILGQVVEAYERAVAQETAGPVLSALFRQAIYTGKRARTETGIGRNAVSVSHAAVKLAQRIFGDLASCRVLLIGAGEMAELAAKNLIDNGARDLTVINRTWERAQAFASRFHSRCLPWGDLPQALEETDIVISSTAAPHIVVEVEAVRQALAARGDRPLLLIDIAVPRDIDPAVGQLEGVHLYDVDGLENVTEENLEERRREIPRVKAIIAEEVDRFMEHFTSLKVAPTIASLREWAHSLREAELERALHRLNGLSEQEQEIIRLMTARLVNKMLHPLTTCLKGWAVEPVCKRYVSCVHDLFNLSDKRGRSHH